MWKSLQTGEFLSNLKNYENPGLKTIQEKDYLVSGSALLSLLQAVLDKGANFRFKARGTSMVPFIHDGDLITIAPLTRVATGSIVAFTRPETGQLVVHRVVAKRREEFFISGDGSSLHSDGWIPRKNIVGQLTKIERNGQNIRLSLGMERIVIAFLSRLKWLTPIRVMLAKFLHKN